MVMQGATADIGDTAVVFVYVTSSLLGSGKGTMLQFWEQKCQCYGVELVMLLSCKIHQ